jgi:DNA-binding response OmpR family regulator
MAKILIIEDDQDLARLMGIKLKADGHDLAFAADAVTATTAARREKPDLVLLDIGLPGGDGLLVLRRLRDLAMTTLTPVIVVSGREPAATRDSVLEAGAAGYLAKPFETSALVAEVNRVLGS